MPHNLTWKTLAVFGFYRHFARLKLIYERQLIGLFQMDNTGNIKPMNEQSLNNSLDKINNTFMMYGDPAAPYWLLGLEEAGGPKQDNANTASKFIDSLGKEIDKYNETSKSKSLRDLCGSNKKDTEIDKRVFLPDSELLKQGSNAYKLMFQKTWGGYIKLLHAVWNKHENDSLPWNLHEVKTYQEKYLGEYNIEDADKKTCLMELFALPRPGREPGDWKYSALAELYPSLSYLSSGEDYCKHVVDTRVGLLRQSINSHRPRFLFCFGTDSRDALAFLELTDKNRVKLSAGKSLFSVSSGYLDETLVVFSPHPTATGVSDLFWKNLGAYIGELPSPDIEKAA